MRSRNKVSGYGVLLVVGSLLLLAGCASMEKMSYTIDSSSSAPGRSVKLAGEVRELGGTPIMVGSHLPESYMIDAFSLRSVDISQMKGKVLFLSLVPSLENVTQMKFFSSRQPSLDNKLFDAQTRYLAKQRQGLSEDVVRIAISRDTPYEQQRVAKKAHVTGITYLSDFRGGVFGRSTGLLVKKQKYLARAVIIVDKQGIVRYIQVVPELTHLPDMERAFSVANELASSEAQHLAGFHAMEGVIKTVGP